MTDKDKVPTWKFPPRTVKQLLKRARKVLAKESCWTQHVPARRGNGTITSPYDPDAQSFCLLGALERGAVKDYLSLSPTGMRALDRAAGRGAVEFNDSATTTHTDVLDALDRAIKEVSQ